MKFFRNKLYRNSSLYFGIAIKNKLSDKLPNKFHKILIILAFTGQKKNLGFQADHGIKLWNILLRAYF